MVILKKEVKIILLIVLLLPFSAHAKQHRGQAARHEFARINPCPSTGKSKLPCPGFIIDHVIPLCAGGPDNPSNMQWQTKADAAAKDKIEWRECRAIRRK